MNIIELANESGLTYYGMGKDRAKFNHYLKAFADLVAAQEREECAKLVVDLFDPADNVAEFIAEKILARGTP